MDELPKTGPLPRPASPVEAREMLKTEAFEAPDVQMIVMSAVEFTSICPRTGQPDFGSVEIRYQPLAHCIESKALKYYLWSFRNEGVFCEDLAATIANDVVYAVAPRFVSVEVRQNIRGGIGITATATRGRSDG